MRHSQRVLLRSRRHSDEKAVNVAVLEPGGKRRRRVPTIAALLWTIAAFLAVLVAVGLVIAR